MMHAFQSLYYQLQNNQNKGHFSSVLMYSMHSILSAYRNLFNDLIEPVYILQNALIGVLFWRFGQSRFVSQVKMPTEATTRVKLILTRV